MFSNYRDAGDLRRHRAHYDVNVMLKQDWMANGIKWYDCGGKHETNLTYTNMTYSKNPIPAKQSSKTGPNTLYEVRRYDNKTQ